MNITDLELGDVVAYYYYDDYNGEYNGMYLAEVSNVAPTKVTVEELYTTATAQVLDALELPNDCITLLEVVEKRTPIGVLIKRVLPKYPEYTL